jgi:hypothetical protein
MAAKVLKSNGQTLVRTTFRPLTADELLMEDEKKKRNDFDRKIKEILGEGFKPEDWKDDPDVETPLLQPYGDELGDEPRMPDAEDVDVDAYDQYVGAEVTLPRGDSMLNARVIGRKRERDGSLRGKANANPIIDSRTYNVMFPDGSEAEYTANIIAENMWAQADLDGNQYLLLDSVIDHRKTPDAMSDEESFVLKDGIKYP